MKLIKETKAIFASGRRRKRGLFYCPYCKSEVDKDYNAGQKSNSCGCKKFSFQPNNLYAKKHGDSRTNLYNVWNGMIGRCYCETKHNYCYYGARGIRVCVEWRKNWLSFKKWALENGYSKGLQIDRVDNDGDYTPKNCRFITCQRNVHNRSTTKLNFHNVRKIRKKYESNRYTHKQLSSEFGVCRQTIGLALSNTTWKEDGAHV